MKRKEEQIAVWFDANQPVTLQRNGRAVSITEVVERWDVRGRWWAKDTRRHYMTVRTDRGTFELCAEHGSKGWKITATYD